MPTFESPTESDRGSTLARSLAIPRHARSALRLVWALQPRLALGLLSFSALSGLLPAAIAYVAKLLIDAVSQAASTRASHDTQHAFLLLGVELGLVVVLLACHRALAFCDALLRLQLTQSLTQQVLEQVTRLDLVELESAELQDELRIVREQASERPLSLVRRVVIALQQGATLLGLLALLIGFSPWLVALVLVATLPALWIELRLNADTFRLFRANSPEARRQRYLEHVLTRSEHAKELKAYDAGPALVQRHREIFDLWYPQDRALSLRRAAWGVALGLVSTLALGASLLWVTFSTIGGTTTLGSLALLFLVLRQAQVSGSDLISVLAGMHDDNLYLTSLRRFLARPATTGGGMEHGPAPGTGLRLEEVSFSYPGASTPALRDLSLHLPAGARISVLGKNGAGKSTLLKLLAGLYRPSRGRISLDGLALEEWEPSALRSRMAVMFQDFGRYQLSAGENIGLGHPQAFASRPRWSEAAREALIGDLIAALPRGYDTPLGQGFAGGRELSLGEWQRLALARVFTRRESTIVVLDEPTSSLDQAAEVLMLEALTRATEGKTAILVSHRATWTDPEGLVVVLDGGRCVAQDTLAALELAGSPYAPGPKWSA